MEGQISIAEWQQWKEDIRKRLNETVENFMAIGYRLRQIKDTEAYRNDGYSTLTEFAKAEYNLSQSTVSRFMAISHRFSVGGEGHELLPEFKGMEYSKLQEMLSIPESDCGLLTPKTTVREIKSLKEFNQADPVASNEAEPEYTPLQTCIKDYFSSPGRRSLLNETVLKLSEGDRGAALMEQLADNINPSGYATHRKGTVYLFMYDHGTGATVKFMGQPVPRRMTWEELLEEISAMYSPYMDAQGETWCNVYGPAPDGEQITGQMDITQVKAEKKPVNTVHEGKPGEKKKKKSRTEPSAGMTEEEKQILAAAVDHVLSVCRLVRELKDRSLENVRIALLKEPPERDFGSGQQRYHMRFSYGKTVLKNAEDGTALFTWGTDFFTKEILKELEKTPLPEPEPLEGEYREISIKEEPQEEQPVEEPERAEETVCDATSQEKDCKAAGMEDTREIMRMKAETAAVLINTCFMSYENKVIPLQELCRQRDRVLGLLKNLEGMIEAEEKKVEEYNA